MSIKVYKDVNGKRLYRVHAYGKVETSTNGRNWFKINATAKQVNHWKKSGTVVRMNEGQPKGGSLALIEEELAYLEEFMATADNLRELIPMHPTSNSAYERRNLQTVKCCASQARGCDEWDAQHLLDTINKGLSLPAKMRYRGEMVEVRIQRLKASHRHLLAMSAPKGVVSESSCCGDR